MGYEAEALSRPVTIGKSRYGDAGRLNTRCCQRADRDNAKTITAPMNGRITSSFNLMKVGRVASWGRRWYEADVKENG